MLERMSRLGEVVNPVLVVAFVTAILVWPDRAAGQEGGYGAGRRATVLFVPLQRGEDVPEGVPGRIEEYFKALVEIDPKVKLVSLSLDDMPPEPAGPPPVVITTIAPPAPAPEKPAAATPVSNPDVERAIRLAASGREAVGQRKYDKALGLLTQAKGLFSRNLDKLEDFENFADVHIWLAVAFFEGGYMEEAGDAVNKLVVLRPEVSLDKGKASKRFLDALDAAKRRTRSGGPIEVTVSPVNATVYVDGRLVGTGTTGDLPKGTHYVRVVGDGMVPAVRTVANGPAGKAVAVSVGLKAVGSATPAPQPERKAPAPSPVRETGAAKPLTWYARNGEFAGTFSRDARAAAEKVMADFVMLGFLARSEKTFHLGIFLYDTRGGETVGIEPSIIDADLGNLQIALLDLESRVSNAISTFPRDRIVKARPAIYSITARKATPAPAAVAVVPAPRVVAPPPAPVKTTPAPAAVAAGVALPARSSAATGGFDEIPSDFPMEALPVPTTTPWYKKWWVWTISGAVLAGAAVGTTVMVMKKGGGTSTFSGTAKW